MNINAKSLTVRKEKSSVCLCEQTVCLYRSVMSACMQAMHNSRELLAAVGIRHAFLLQLSSFLLSQYGLLIKPFVHSVCRKKFRNQVSFFLLLLLVVVSLLSFLLLLLDDEFIIVVAVHKNLFASTNTPHVRSATPKTILQSMLYPGGKKTGQGFHDS